MPLPRSRFFGFFRTQFVHTHDYILKLLRGSVFGFFLYQTTSISAWTDVVVRLTCASGSVEIEIQTINRCMPSFLADFFSCRRVMLMQIVRPFRFGISRLWAIRLEHRFDDSSLWLLYLHNGNPFTKYLRTNSACERANERVWHSSKEPFGISHTHTHTSES